MQASTTQQIDHLGDLWTVEAAARQLNSTYWTLNRLIKQQRLPTYSLGTARLVRLNDLRPYL
jgi:excisionase family DNA binding protein